MNGRFKVLSFHAATLVAGVATFSAYLLVLLALQRAAAAPVAAVRETSVVLTALLIGNPSRSVLFSAVHRASLIVISSSSRIRFRLE